MSTSVSRPPRSKKLSCCVRPGVLEVRASVLRPVKALTRLDLPTFDRPAKAISGSPASGMVESRVEPLVKRHSWAKSSRPASSAAGAGASSSGSSLVILGLGQLPGGSGAPRDYPLLQHG